MAFLDREAPWKRHLLAGIFTAISAVFLAVWIWPEPYEPVGDLTNKDIVQVNVRDLAGHWFAEQGDANVRALVGCLDRGNKVRDLPLKMNHGSVRVSLITRAGRQFRLELVCSEVGTVIDSRSRFIGEGPDSAMALIAAQFPQGKWCGPWPR